MIWSSLNICCEPWISTVCVFNLFIILIPSQYCFVQFWYDFCRFSCPRSRNPVFCPVVWFFKKYIFGIYILWGVSGCKNFTGQILSGIRFYPKLIIIRHFSYFVTTFWLRWSSIACSGLFMKRGVPSPDTSSIIFFEMNKLDKHKQIR